MLGTGRSGGVARFEGFELDLRSAELRKPNGTIIRLSEQPLRILIALLERPSELVLREDLRKRLWPNDTIVEFEHSISAAMNRLRQALGDSAESPKFIETLARRGYRWKTPVTWEQPQIASVPAKPANGNLVGKKVSHYRVLQVVGGGGMGVVYKAEDMKLGRPIALKFLPEELAGDPAAMQRFEREARAASALNHPNICTIHAVEEHEGQPFIVMELLEGRTLRDVIADGAHSNSTLPTSTLLDIAIQIAQGLEVAHQKGIIHRDIKPANVFITSHGRVKILDFGLAKLHEFETAEAQSHVSTQLTSPPEWNPLLTLTRTGTTVGTAAYMSPEQVRGEKLDVRTDLFSFGLVLYEMATRQRAFPGDSAALVHQGILNETPAPPRDLNPHAPAKLESIINSAIQKDRDLRYQTAYAIRADLEDLQRQLAPKRLPRAWVLGLGAAAAIFIVIFFLLLMKKPKAISVAPEIRMRQLTTNSIENPVIGGLISPDGKYLAYSDTRGLHIKVIDTGETRKVSQPEALKGQSMKWEVGSWFPDSTRFLVNTHPATEAWDEWSSVNSSVWAVSVLGGAPSRLRDHAVGWGVSPDGSQIAFSTKKGKIGEREVWFMGPDGEKAWKLQETGDDSAICCFGWSPDGKHYMYAFANSSGDTILSRDVKGGPAVTLFQSSELEKTNDIVWLHDGRVIYDLPESENDSVRNYWVMRLDIATGMRVDKPRRLTNWPGFFVSNGSVSNDDKRFAFAAASGFFTTYVADLEVGGTHLGNARHFTWEESDNVARGWTADGKVIIARQQGSSWAMYTQSLDSDTPEPIASAVGRGWLQLGTTSPDGNWFIGRFWPETQIVQRLSVPLLPILRVPLAGGAPETTLQFSRHGNVSCARPPSDTCVIAQDSEDRKQMVVANFDPIKGVGAELARFNLDREFDALELLCAISPDGTRLAIARSQDSPIEIHSLHGQLIHKIPSQSLGTLIGFVWAMDQKGLFVTTRAQSGSELMHLGLQGNVTSLRKCIGLGTCFGLPSPDGRHMAVIDRNQSTNMWMMENF